jgi:hypothetical protein
MLLFFTDFIRHRTIQISIALCIFFDIVISKSIKHTLILFGLPYLISIVMYYRYKPQKNRIKARISEQYRNKTTSNYPMFKSK